MADILQFPQLDDPVLLRQALRLLKAFIAIVDPAKRSYIVEFVEGLAGTPSGGTTLAVHPHKEGERTAPSNASRE